MGEPMSTMIYHLLNLPVSASDSEVLEVLGEKIKAKDDGTEALDAMARLRESVLDAHHAAQQIVRDFRL